MLAFRSWIALGLLAASSGTGLAQITAPPGNPPASGDPAPVVYYITRGADGPTVTATPALNQTQQQQIDVVTELVADGPGQAAATGDVLIQERSPNASMKLYTDLLANNPATQGEWPWFLRDMPNEQGLGGSFEPADDSLRAQLDIPKGQGLVVTSVAPGGPAARIGVAPNDILLTLGDKPVATAEDLAKVVKSSGDEPISLKLLRRGKSLTIRVKPEHHVTLGPVATSRTRYLIGVQVTPVEGALRSHLGLPDDQGLLVSSVEKGTPAEKAELKKNDILVAIGDKPLTGTENLVARVQESRGKPITIKLLRAGKSQSVEVTPDERKETIDVTVTAPERTVLRAIRPTQTMSRWLATPRVAPPASGLGGFTLQTQPQNVDRNNELLREVKELRKAVEQLHQALKRHEELERKDK